jgi:predicted AlkP superfamily pyrophosphatase or phosphodiesterase
MYQSSLLRTSLRALLAALVLLSLLPAPAPAGRSGVRSDRHVLLISIDGFAAYYLDDPRVPLPNIRRLAAEGARADGMTVVTPSVTWPNHTTLVTGVSPARHGVLVNGKIEPGTGPTPLVINPRRSKQELCRAPTVYDLAHAAGLRTAEVNWPVTREAPSLNWSFPDHPDALRYTTPALVKVLQEQTLLPNPTDEAFRSLGSVSRDRVWTQAAVHLLRRHRPHLLLLHLLNTDSTQHAHGPQTTEAYTALSLADRHVGDVIQAVKDAGLQKRTAVFVTADHGFSRVTHQIRPNARLRAAGLIRAVDGKLEYDAGAIPAGGVALVYIPGAKRQPDLLARTREALSGLEGVERIIMPEEYPALGLPLASQDPQAPDLVLAARDGYSFSSDAGGEPLVQLPRPNGTHGYVHTNPKMDALFVAAGAGIRRGVRLERVRSVDVAPTVARLLGLSMADVEGRPLQAALER